jgi:hypothetical protein
MKMLPNESIKPRRQDGRAGIHHPRVETSGLCRGCPPGCLNRRSLVATDFDTVRHWTAVERVVYDVGKPACRQ